MRGMQRPSGFARLLVLFLATGVLASCETRDARPPERGPAARGPSARDAPEPERAPSKRASPERPARAAKAAKATNVIIVVIDGARYTETWGDPARRHVPHMANDLAPLGVVYTDFRNEGVPKTCPGHVAVTTGGYEKIANNGSELPSRPSITQLWLAHSGEAAEKAWVVTGKKKLFILADSSAPGWKGKHVASTDCGPPPSERGHRSDKATWERLREILAEHHPRLVVVNLSETDAKGHSGRMEAYLEALRAADGYVWELWRFLQSDAFYKGKTALLVTHDHGRHDDEHGGMSGHGCDCEGCRRLIMVGAGPGVRRGVVIEEPRELVDIARTVGEILGFAVPDAKGDVLRGLFEETPKAAHAAPAGSVPADGGAAAPAVPEAVPQAAP